MKIKAENILKFQILITAEVYLLIPSIIAVVLQILNILFLIKMGILYKMKYLIHLKFNKIVKIQK